jgi:hypothetical protein
MMRLLFGAVVFSLMAVSACALVSGVSGYEELTSADDASVSHLTKDTGIATEHDALATQKDTAPAVDGDVSDDVSTPDEGTEASVEDATSEAEASEGTDAALPVDTGSPDDANSVPDVAPDAPPPACGPMTCSHCCSGGECVGGQSVTTCGTGGEACKDCTSMGGACGTNGSCTTPVKDAAPPPTCTASHCGGCVNGFQRGCCKSDETCGCVWIYIPGSSCQ